jgi:hypothetical protein
MFACQPFVRVHCTCRASLAAAAATWARLPLALSVAAYPAERMRGTFMQELGDGPAAYAGHIQFNIPKGLGARNLGGREWLWH